MSMKSFCYVSAFEIKLLDTELFILILAL